MKVDMEMFEKTGLRAMVKQALVMAAVFSAVYLLLQLTYGFPIYPVVVETIYAFIGAVIISPLFVGVYQLVIRATGAAE